MIKWQLNMLSICVIKRLQCSLILKCPRRANLWHSARVRCRPSSNPMPDWESCSSSSMNQSECIQASFAQSAKWVLLRTSFYLTVADIKSTPRRKEVRPSGEQLTHSTTFHTHWLHSHSHTHTHRDAATHTSILTLPLLVGITFLSWANWVLSIFEFSTKSGSGWLCRRKRKHSHYSA